jgi:hypothetical protein
MQAGEKSLFKRNDVILINIHAATIIKKRQVCESQYNATLLVINEGRRAREAAGNKMISCITAVIYILFPALPPRRMHKLQEVV